MTTPISQFDFSEIISAIGEFVEKAFMFSPGFEEIITYLGITPGDVTVMNLLSTVAVLVSLVLMVGILYSIIRVSQLHSTDKMVKRAFAKRGRNVVDNQQWRKILNLTHTDNPHDWKLALREADIMLDVAVTEKGYRGTTFEDRLVRLPDSEDAELAHQGWVEYIQIGGDQHMLTKVKVKEVLKHYERALKKLGVL